MLDYLDYTVDSPRDSTFSLMGFSSPVTSVAVSANRTVFACTLNGQLYIDTLPEPSPSLADPRKKTVDWARHFSATPGRRFSPITRGTSHWALATSPASSDRQIDLCVIGSSLSEPCGVDSGQASLFTSAGSMQSKVAHPHPIRSVDWLDANVSILGSTRTADTPATSNSSTRASSTTNRPRKTKSNDRTPTGLVSLWDARTSGLSQRFTQPGPVTGVRGLGDGHSLLTCSTDGMRIFDVRMSNNRHNNNNVSQPVLTIDAPSTMPNPAFDVAPGPTRLVVRRDDEDALRVYSLLDGREVRKLEMTATQAEYGYARMWIRTVRFKEDANGELGIWACRGGRVDHWSFGGKGDDEG